MKKIFVKILGFSVAVMLVSSCMTVNQASKEAVGIPPLSLSRADYTLTDDVNAEAEVRVYLGFIMRGADKKNIKIGQIQGLPSNPTIDERLAVYNLIEQNPEFDYLTNVRYYKTFIKKPFKKTYKTKVVAKGIILKADK